MTTPDEQIRALKNINDLLIDLCYIRNRADRLEMARKLLRHYPQKWEIDLYWKKAPTDSGEKGK